MRRTILACAVLGLSSTASADVPTLSATGLFGDAVVVPELDNDFVVRVVTDRRSPFEGEVSIEQDDGDGSGVRASVPLRMGPGETRELVISMPSGEGVGGYVARLRERGRPVRTVYVTQHDSYNRSFVVLADPPRIRATLDAIVAAQNPGSTYVSPQDRYAVGVVGTERRSADPRVPHTHFGWAGTELVIATTQMIERLDARGLAALRAHVLAGGTMLLFPADSEDLKAPQVRALTGVLDEAPPLVVTSSPYLPADVAPCRYVGPDVVRTEPWGVTVARGFGVVHVACFDGNTTEHAQAPSTRLLIEQLREEVSELSSPILGQGSARTSTPAGTESQIELLRRALDSNEGARGALPLVAIVLIVYVVLVGPVGFGWAERRGKPTLALVTTPLLAFGCLTLLLLTGAVAKGFRNRARSVALVEVTAGERIAVERRVTSLFYGRPMAPDLTASANTRVATVRQGMSGNTTIDASGERPVLRAFRGGLWATRLLRSDRTLDLRGALETTFDGTLLVRVTNHSRIPLVGAVAVDARGVCYRIGDLAPGASKPVSTRSVACMLPGTVPYTLESDVLDPLATALGIGRSERPLLNGLFTYAGTLRQEGTLSVIARLPRDQGIEHPTFAVERELRLLRVVVRAPIPAFPLPSFPAPAEGGQETDADAGVPGDGGAP